MVKVLLQWDYVDYFRIPKRAWYWYQSAYAKGKSTPSEPQWAQPGIPSRIKLTADKMTLSAPDGTDDTHNFDYNH